MLERAIQVRRVLWAILFANWAVAGVKLFFGLASGSTALTADGVHSFIDGGSNVIGLFAMAFAARPPDRQHPYGHEKFEALASLAIGAMIGVALLELGKVSLRALLHAQQPPEVSNLMIAVTVATLLVNLVITRAETAQGRRLSSPLLLADAQHTLSDVFVSAVVIVSLVLSRLGIPRADGAVGLLVLVFVARAAWNVTLQAVRPLADSARLDPEVVAGFCAGVAGVRRVHGVRSRGMADTVRVDLKVDVDPTLPLVEAHAIADAVEAELRGRYPEIADVVVHVEPAR